MRKKVLITAGLAAVASGGLALYFVVPPCSTVQAVLQEPTDARIASAWLAWPGAPAEEELYAAITDPGNSLAGRLALVRLLARRETRGARRRLGDVTRSCRHGDAIMGHDRGYVAAEAVVALYKHWGAEGVHENLLDLVGEDSDTRQATIQVYWYLFYLATAGDAANAWRRPELSGEAGKPIGPPELYVDELARLLGAAETKGTLHQLVNCLWMLPSPDAQRLADTAAVKAQSVCGSATCLFSVHQELASVGRVESLYTCLRLCNEMGPPLSERAVEALDVLVVDGNGRGMVTLLGGCGNAYERLKSGELSLRFSDEKGAYVASSARSARARNAATSRPDSGPAEGPVLPTTRATGAREMR